MSGSDRGSFSSVSLQVGADWRSWCHTYDSDTPIFVIDAGASSVSITVKGRKADKAAVEFARSFLRDAQKFAAEVERMHVVQAAIDSATADGATAA